MCDSNTYTCTDLCTHGHYDTYTLSVSCITQWLVMVYVYSNKSFVGLRLCMM